MAFATKDCFRCGVTKPISEFYRHPQMADGHLGKCIDCTRADVKRNYTARHDAKLAYERERFGRPERRRQVATYKTAHRKRHPDRERARRAVAEALRSGKLSRQPCSDCGSTKKVQAHHRDYSRPLDVEWLCFKHHRERRHGQTVAQAPA